MDVPRGREVARRKTIRRIVFIAITIAAIPLITWGLSRLKPAAPSVERGTVWIDSVRRGRMVREVRGLGTLVVEEFMWIPAAFDSRVEKINFLPGAKVHANDVVMVLSNPQMQLDATDLEWQIKQAEANYRRREVRHGARGVAGRSRHGVDQARFQVGARDQAYGGEMAGVEGPLRAFQRAAGHQRPGHPGAVGRPEGSDRETARRLQTEEGPG